MKKLSLLWIVFLTILSTSVLANDNTENVNSSKPQVSDTNETNISKTQISDTNETNASTPKKADSNNTKITLWNSSVDLGVQILPDYNENGDNKGFSKTRPFVDINFDSRWSSCLDGSGATYNTGIDIKLLGTATDNNRSSPTTFDNVSNTVDTSFYLQIVPSFLHLGLSRNISSEIGVIVHVGARSRDHISDSNDTISLYYDAGIKYTYFNSNPYTKGFAQKLPEFYIGAYYRRYNNYNNFSNPNRTIVEFKYLVSPKTNFYIGAETNIGDYQNEMYLTVTYRFGIDKIADLFALKPPEAVTPPQ